MNRSESKARQRRRLNTRNANERRGVLLLVVLSMLVLFLLVGTTFLLTSGQYRTASKIVEKKNRTTFQPADLLERALMQLVRDTNNATSVVRYHSLLRDLYGVDGFVARVYGSANAIDADGTNPGLSAIAVAGPRYAGATLAQPLGPTEGQLVDLLVLDAENRPVLDPYDANAVGLDFDEQGLPINHVLSTVNGHYDGCLLTFTTGPCRGESVRIVSYEYLGSGSAVAAPSGLVSGNNVGGVGRFRIMAPRRADGGQLNVLNGLITDLIDGELGHRFIVNGRPFNGAGVGYNPLALSSDRTDAPTARLSAVEGVRFSNTPDDHYGFEIALTPNATHFDFARVTHLKRNRHSGPFSENLIYDPNNPLDPANDYAYLNTLGDVALTPRERPLYRNYAGPGDTDESYDAPDTQNMALASQALEPRSRGRVVNAAGVASDPDAYYSSPGAAAPAYLDLEGVTIPSFHRPALVNFWFHRLLRNQWLTNLIPDSNNRARAILEPYDAAGTAQFGLNAQQASTLAAIKRKFLLRPLREDHPDFDGSNPLSRYSSARLRAALDGGTLVNAKGTGGDPTDDEITFPYWEATGPWDVDNDGDGVNDSVWVDIGLPVQQTEDGRWYKPLVAMLVEDLDGRLNLNAHGSDSELVRGSLDASNDGGGFLLANLAQDSQRFGSAISDTTLSSWLRSSNQLPEGSGWGTAETSLRSVLSPTLPYDETFAGLSGYAGNAQYDDYARLLRGRPAPSDAGRTTASPLSGSVAFGRYGSQRGFQLSTVPAVVPQPGRTYPSDPALVSDARAYRSVRDTRTPLEFLGYPAYTGAVGNNMPEALSGFGSSLDLRGRYSTGLSTVGSAINEPGYESSQANTFPAGSTWRELAMSAPDDSPYELDLSVAARKLPPAGVTSAVVSYDPDANNQIDPNAAPLNDDAPFSPAELERVLRALDADADELPNRLWEVVDAFDPTKLAAQSRVNNAVRNGGNPDVPLGNPNTLENAVASARAAINRRLVTTDSFDLPVPNENWADRLALGADGRPGVPEFETIGDWVPTNKTLFANDDGDIGIGEPGVDDDGDGTIDEADDVFMTDEGDEVVIGYNAATQSHTFADGSANGLVVTYDDLFDAGCDDYVVVMRQDPPQPGRLTDFIKYRITLELLRKGTIDFTDILTRRTRVERHIQEVLFGADRQAAYSRLRDTTAGSIDQQPLDVTLQQPLISYGGLLAPEVLAGRRMDLNRPLGDGRDNNGNGIVDEPQEAGEPFVDANGNDLITTGEYLDLDRDGFWYGDNNTNGVFYLDSDGDGDFDGFDPGDIDTNGDGVVDSLRVDHLWFDVNGDGIENTNEVRPFDHVGGVDANGRGAYVTNDTTRQVHDDARMARQLFARHLYCLMLALVDENYLAPYDSDDPQVLHYLDPLSGVDGGGGVPVEDSSEAYRIAHDLRITNPGVPELLIRNRARQIAQRKLTRRTIAQWAINVVDFRDPDSIQTPFEYDENPWDGWNVVDRANGGEVFPIDGDISTDENLAMTKGSFTAPSTPRTTIQRLDWTRGVVWGAERPEVLLTEGVAWHDRRLEDIADTSIDDGGDLAGDDDDLDQLRKPKGFAYVEAYNPWIGSDQRPAELYSHIDRSGTPTIERGVRLDRLSDHPRNPARPQTTRSPVWRIACVEEHPLVRNATVLHPSPSDVSPARPIASASDDPPMAAGNQLQYLNETIENGPWLYNTDGDPAIGSGLTVNLDGQSVAIETLPHAYLRFHQKKFAEAQFALTTAGGYATGIGYSGPDFIEANPARDADGLLVPFGVVETPPTVPDTSFPAFDRLAQPFAPKSNTLQISSTLDGNNGSIIRGVSRKPTTFIERVFYMAAARPAETESPAGVIAVPDPNDPDNPRTKQSAPALLVPDQLGTDLLAATDLEPPNSPGFRIPRLVYEVGVAAPGAWRSAGPQVGVEESENGTLLVHASKFASAFDRFDLDNDGNRIEPIGFAPLIPGRRAVIGTTGDIYAQNFPAAGEPTRVPTFTGDDAREMADRYASLMSQSEDSAKGPDSSNPPVPGAPTAQAVIRRLEMLPSADPNRNQFMIRMNGLNESLSLIGPPLGGLDPTDTRSFNLTSVAATERSNPALGANAPIVAIPINHFSISEPVDEYFVRQVELDRGLAKAAQLAYVNERAANAPREEYFSAAADPADLQHFDEPFDLLPELIENQTTPNYRSLHLERLANPLLPWNPPPTRPDGTPITQHDPQMPVNPYLPVDARSLDLTSFNSFTMAEKSVKPTAEITEDNEFVTPGSEGPETRHRRKRDLWGPNGPLGTSRETVIGFVSNERGRPLGPFPALWFAQPARLLWRSAGPSTISEIAHRYNTDERNGYLAEAIDYIVGVEPGSGASPPPPSDPFGPLGRNGTHFDERELAETGGAGAGYPQHFIDVPWRWSLGFGDWMDGRFYVGNALRWFTTRSDIVPPPIPPAYQDVDIDGDTLTSDLIGRPLVFEDWFDRTGNGEVDNDDDANGYPDDYQDADVDGRPDVLQIVDLRPPSGNRPDAREFFEEYLKSRLHDNSTTPEFSWPNRPFASSGELMQVPVWGGSRILTRFSVFNWLHNLQPNFLNRTQINPYNGEAQAFHDGIDYDPSNPPAAANVVPPPYLFNGRFDDDFDGPLATDDTPGTGDDDANLDGYYDSGNGGLSRDSHPFAEADATNQLRWRETLGHFGHLMNFFQTARFPSFTRVYGRPLSIGADQTIGTADDGDSEEYVVPRGASHFYRLMDYVHVPSRYTATDTLLNLSVFSETSLPLDDARRGLSAPFNRVDNYREPGRVNLNTVVGRRDATEPARQPLDGSTVPRLPDYWSEVYDGLMQRNQDGSLIDYPSSSLLKAGHLGPAWRDVALSRRGYVQPGFDPTASPLDATIGLGSASQNQIDYSPRRMNPDFPTLFANPFRAPGEGANVPLDHMVQTGVDATLLRAHPLSPGADGAWGRRGVDDLTVDKSGENVADNDGNRDDANEAGVLPIELGVGSANQPALQASDRINADVVLGRFLGNDSLRRGALPDTFLEDAFRTSPLAVNPRNVSAAQSASNDIYNAEISKRATPVALFSGASLEPSLDTERNPTLRYLPIQRMSNLTTTRSNVYAVWITVGFFEVKPAREDARVWPRYLTDSDGDGDGDTFIDDSLEALFNKVYPGGWMLGQEIGIDTGEDRRHRGFYMVDRSRPVAFKPGEDANVSDAILIRRRIQ